MFYVLKSSDIKIFRLVFVVFSSFDLIFFKNYSLKICIQSLLKLLENNIRITIKITIINITKIQIIFTKLAIEFTIRHIKENRQSSTWIAGVRIQLLVWNKRSAIYCCYYCYNNYYCCHYYD